MRDLPHYLTAVVFLLAAGAMFRQGWRLRHGPDRPSRRNEHLFWYILGLLFVLFAGLKVVAILPGTGNLLRQMAMADGFHAQRQALQRVTIGLLVVFSAVGVGAMLTYGMPRRMLLPLIGVIAIVGFAAVRWVSLHAVDQMMGRLPWLVPVVEIAGAITAVWPTLFEAEIAHATRHGRGRTKHRTIRP